MALYSNSELGLSIAAISNRNNNLHAEGKQYCPVCMTVKMQDAFNTSDRGPGRFGRYCIECKKKANRARYIAKGQFEVPAAHRLRVYGLTQEAYMALRAEQGNKCGICGDDLLSLKEIEVNVDHDHRTGAVRGVLCCTCNTGLAAFLDDPTLIDKAAVYLAQAFIR